MDELLDQLTAIEWSLSIKDSSARLIKEPGLLALLMDQSLLYAHRCAVALALFDLFPWSQHPYQQAFHSHIHQPDGLQGFIGLLLEDNRDWVHQPLIEFKPLAFQPSPAIYNKLKDLSTGHWRRLKPLNHIVHEPPFTELRSWSRTLCHRIVLEPSLYDPILPYNGPPLPFLPIQSNEVVQTDLVAHRASAIVFHWSRLPAENLAH